MPKRITPGQIKMNNRQQIYSFIYRRGKVSQQDMLYELRLSRPTVATNLSALEDEGLVCKSGVIESDQIGRKATAYAIVADYRIAVGVEVMRNVVKLIAVDLYGRKLRREVLDMRYTNEPAYYQSVCAAINAFIDALAVARAQVLGIGISMQAVASPDGRSVVYGAILGCTGLKIDVFEQWLDHPCAFIHDPRAAALSELWATPELSDAMYLSLSRHLGGSMIVDRRIIDGRHGHNATFEHIQVDPDGERCYCGRRGCWDTRVSMKALLDRSDPDAFFDAVRAGNPAEAARWSAYLDDLAALIGDLHLVYDVDFILGGHLASYLTEADLGHMYAVIRERCPFDDRADDFIRISKMPSHNITIGSALPFIQAFLEELGIDAREG